MAIPLFKTEITVTDTSAGGYLKIVGEGATQAEADSMAETVVEMMRCIIVSYYRSQLIRPSPVGTFSTAPGATKNCQLWLVNASANREPVKLFLIDSSFFTGLTIDIANLSVQALIAAFRDSSQTGGYSLQSSLVVS